MVSWDIYLLIKECSNGNKNPFERTNCITSIYLSLITPVGLVKKLISNIIISSPTKIINKLNKICCNIPQHLKENVIKRAVKNNINTLIDWFKWCMRNLTFKCHISHGPSTSTFFFVSSKTSLAYQFQFLEYKELYHSGYKQSTYIIISEIKWYYSYSSLFWVLINHVRYWSCGNQYEIWSQNDITYNWRPISAKTAIVCSEIEILF